MTYVQKSRTEINLMLIIYIDMESIAKKGINRFSLLKFWVDK